MGLLAASAGTYSLPFMPIDARGLAMGGTGVASSRLAHAPAYNPSLLTQAQEDDDFAILFPQIGAVAADEGDVINTGKSIKDTTFPKFDKLFDQNSSNNLRTSLDELKTASTSLSTELDGLSGLNLGNASSKYTSLKTANDNFSNSVSNVRSKIDEVNKTTDELNKKLGDISGNPLRARAGVATAFAFPSKKLAFALSISGDINLSARATFSQQDKSLISSYGKAVDGYSEQMEIVPKSVNDILGKVEQVKNGDGSAIPTPTDITGSKSKVEGIKTYDSETVSTAGGDIKIIENGALSNDAKSPKLNSKIQFAGMFIAEVGLSAAREFNIKNRNVSFGVTPKVVMVKTFHYGSSLDNEKSKNDDGLEDSMTSHVGVNFDLGASYRFGEDSGWMAGVTIKNLIPKTYKTKDAKIKNKDGIVIDTLKGPELKINPQLRIGGAYENDWFMGTAELDVTENKPVAFEKATRYLAFGAEFDLYDTAQFRTGLRSNLSADSPLEQSVVSLGLGLSPSIVEINLAAMVNPFEPKRELGLAFEMGVAF